MHPASLRPASFQHFSLRFCFTWVFVLFFISAVWIRPVNAADAPLDSWQPVPISINIQKITPSPAYLGQTVTIAVTATGDPTQAILIQTNETTLCTLMVSSGSGSCEFKTPAVGNYQIKAVFTGNTAYLPAVSAPRNLEILAKLDPVLEVVQTEPLVGFPGAIFEVEAHLTGNAQDRSGQGVIFPRTGAQCTLPTLKSIDIPISSKCGFTFGSDGIGSCSFTPATSGVVEMCAAFMGNGAYNSTVIAISPYFIGTENTLPYISLASPNPIVLGQPATIQFKLLSKKGISSDSNPNFTDPVPTTGAIRIYTPTETLCTVDLSAGGCTIAPTQGGSLNLGISYAGSQVGGYTFDPSTGPTYALRVNAAPQAITFSTVLGAIPYQAEVGSQIGRLAVSDANTDETHTLYLVAGTGGTHNALFRIDGDLLLVNADLEPYAGKMISVRIRATDPAGLSFEDDFQFTVTQSPDNTSLPLTGFPLGKTSRIPAQPEESRYHTTGGLTIEIPQLNTQADIIGVPLTTTGWDTTWLDTQAGWLEGSAFPTWEGNAVLAAHNMRANGQPGPFQNLDSLSYGDVIRVHAYDMTYVYAVRSVETVSADDASAFGHKDDAWITLVTCRLFNETTQSYEQRILVQAELVKILR